jgi:1-acyl-sn-glycerol-3-phosphate acyltransferase
MKPFRSIFFYVVVIYSTIFLGIATIIITFVTKKSDLSHLVARLWGNINLWAAGVTVKVEGLENIDLKRPYVYAANHQSWFDIFAVLGKLPVQFRWLAKEELFRFPFLGPAMKASGYIPIDRTDRHKAFESLNEAARRVRSGTSVVIFPEGTRSPDGVLQGFKKGGFILSIKSQQPVVPISISGSHRVLPKRGSWDIQPGIIHMTIGKPIPTAGLTTRDRDGLMSVLREAIRKNLPRSEGGILPDVKEADPSYFTARQHEGNS